MSFEIFLARRYLKIKHDRKLVPLITILATLGVAVGVMVLVVVIAVMTGFQSELKKRILGIESHIVVMRYNERITETDQVASRILALPGIRSASPFILSQGMLRSAQGVSGIILRGIDPEQTAVQVSTGGGKSLRQMLSDQSEGMPKVVLGAVLADKLKVKIGDGLLLMMADANREDTLQLPRMHRLKVGGIYETGMHQYDGAIGFLAIDALQQMLGFSHQQASGIDVRVQDLDAVDRTSQEILASLGTGYWANHWQQMHRNLFSMLQQQKFVMFIILTLIILVAAFNIASALIMMVKEKTRDIAILKAMGASQRSLQLVFLGKGIIIGLSGILIGFFSGLAVCFLLAHYHFITLPGDVYFLTTLPVQIDAVDMGLIVFGTLVVCVFASLFPARQAAGLNPVDGIRFG